MMKLTMLRALVICSMFSLAPTFASLPEAPSEAGHPGNSDYSFEVKRESFRIDNRAIEVFLPDSVGLRFPVIVFGHGQAIGYKGYEMTFEHLARKGIAVIHPQYDSGFFDRNWKRMAKDFNTLTAESIRRLESVIDPEEVIYSGHSIGGYIALLAAGSKGSLEIKPRSIVLFSPADYDRQLLNSLNPKTPLTLIWGERDGVVSPRVGEEIYDLAESKFKQFILVKSYPNAGKIEADHFFPLTKSYLFGGHDGVNSHHYFGSWTWLVGAARDLSSERSLSDPFAYGDRAHETGLQGLEHQLKRSW